MPHFRDVSTGPGSRYAIAAVAGEGPPQDWDRYTNTWLERTIHLNRAARLGTPLTPIRYALVDLRAATATMLWNAPLNPRGGTQWSPRGDRLLMTPTFLPMQDANPLGLTGNAAADIDVSTGNYRVLPVDLTDRNIASAQWRDAGKIDIVTTNQQGIDSRNDRFILITANGNVLPPAAVTQAIPLPQLVNPSSTYKRANRLTARRKSSPSIRAAALSVCFSTPIPTCWTHSSSVASNACQASCPTAKNGLPN
jgi:hypothetical protein